MTAQGEALAEMSAISKQLQMQFHLIARERQRRSASEVILATCDLFADTRWAERDWGC